MQSQLRGRRSQSGGVTGYPLDRLYEEVAYIAYYFHWSMDQVMEMEHAERRRWVEEIAKINRQVSVMARGETENG